MRRIIWFVGVVGLICGGGVFCWRYRQSRRSLTETAGVINRLSATVDSEARWGDARARSERTGGRR